MQVQILAPDRQLGQFEAKSVNLPGVLGYMTVLPEHTEMIAELGIGRLGIEPKNGSEEVFSVAGGYVRIQKDQVMVLADVIENAGQIDKDRAQKAYDRSKKRLDSASQGSIDLSRAQLALKRAETRLALASKGTPS